MSKAKRRRQQNKRAATVHLYCVKQGLIPCDGCPTCLAENVRQQMAAVS